MNDIYYITEYYNLNVVYSNGYFKGDSRLYINTILIYKERASWVAYSLLHYLYKALV